MLEIVVGAHEEIGIRIVQRLPECNNLHVSCLQQGQAARRNQSMKPGAAARNKFVRPNFDQSMHFGSPVPDAKWSSAVAPYYLPEKAEALD